MKSKYPEKYSVTLLKSENFLRGRSPYCLFASLFILTTNETGEEFPKTDISFLKCLGLRKHE